MLDILSATTLASLEKAFEDTFEGIAFAQIYTREKLEQPTPPDPEAIFSYIDLPAPMACRFFVMMKREHVLECFSAVYTGADASEIDDSVLVDFVNELCNTAAGHFASAVAPEKQDMVIGLPVNPEFDEQVRCLTPHANGSVFFFQVEEYAFYASLMRV